MKNASSRYATSAVAQANHSLCRMMINRRRNKKKLCTIKYKSINKNYFRKSAPDSRHRIHVFIRAIGIQRQLSFVLHLSVYPWHTTSRRSDMRKERTTKSCDHRQRDREKGSGWDTHDFKPRRLNAQQHNRLSLSLKTWLFSFSIIICFAYTFNLLLDFQRRFIRIRLNWMHHQIEIRISIANFQCDLYSFVFNFQELANRLFHLEKEIYSKCWGYKSGIRAALPKKMR